MQDFAEAALRAAYATATWEQIREDRDHYSRFKSVGAQESVAILQELLEARLAEDEQASPAEWSKAKLQKPKPLSPAEEKRREEQRIERETEGGRLPPRPKEPESPYRNQLEYEQSQSLMRARLPFKGVHSCPDCRKGYRAPTCTDHCSQPGWWQAKRATFAETAAYEARRGEKE